MNVSIERLVKKPFRLIIWFSDPFDGKFLGSINLPYEQRKAVFSHYSNLAKKMKIGLCNIYPEILNGRKPRIHIEKVF